MSSTTATPNQSTDGITAPAGAAKDSATLVAPSAAGHSESGSQPAKATKFFLSLTEMFKDDPASYQAAVASFQAAQAGHTKTSGNAVVRSTAKAHQPDTFAGTAAEHGPKALEWIEGFALYGDAEHEPHTVATSCSHIPSGCCSGLVA